MLAKRIVGAFGNGELLDALKRAYLNGFVASPFVPRRMRRVLLRISGIEVGKRCYMFAGIRFNGTNVIFEDGVAVNSGCIFDRGAEIKLEQDVRVGFNVTFSTFNHHIGPPDERAFGAYAEPILVGRGTWLANNVLIFPGVTIAPGCIIAAGALVNADCDTPNGIYAGTPAKLVRVIGDDEGVKP